MVRYRFGGRDGVASAAASVVAARASPASIAAQVHNSRFQGRSVGHEYGKHAEIGSGVGRNARIEWNGRVRPDARIGRIHCVRPAERLLNIGPGDRRIGSIGHRESTRAPASPSDR